MTVVPIDGSMIAEDKVKEYALKKEAEQGLAEAGGPVNGLTDKPDQDSGAVVTGIIAERHADSLTDKPKAVSSEPKTNFVINDPNRNADVKAAKNVDNAIRNIDFNSLVFGGGLKAKKEEKGQVPTDNQNTDYVADAAGFGGH